MPPFAQLRDNAAVRQGLLLFVTCTALWMMAKSFDAFDYVDALTHAHEDWELDEIFFALMIGGMAGVVFCIIASVT